MKKHSLTLLLILCACPEAGSAQAASPGSVVAWGNNEFGQATVPVAAQSGVMATMAGGYHTVALKDDGSVVAWGYNRSGEVTGTPTTEYPYAAIASPVTLGDQVLSGVTAIAAGGDHTVALKNDGSVMAWGDNRWGQTTVPVTAQSGVTAIAAGGFHTVALKNDGSVVTWGDNDFGQTTVPVAAQSGVTAIAAGGFHTVALKNDGSVLAWGNNEYGQTTLPVAAQSGMMAIAAASDLDFAVGHTVALKNDGSVVAWGSNGEGQTTVPVAAQSGVTAIAAGYGRTVALKNDGIVLAWGWNLYGQSTVPVTVQGKVTAIAAGEAHTVALLGTVPMMPSLTSRSSGNELILSWTTNAVRFTLQSTLSLTPPVTWADVTNAPALLGAQWTVTNAFSSSAQFYRLRKP